MRPPAFILSGTGSFITRSHLIVHCLLIETNIGLVLVETGFGTQDFIKPSKAVRAFTFLSGTYRDVSATAIHQVARLGYDVKEVQHIVLTHLHLDHAGGILDFPWAKIHIHTLEYETIMNPVAFSGRYYRPEHWAHRPEWVLHSWQGEKWFDFECIRLMEGSSPEILFVPMPGHTPGHCGVAVKTKEGWLLHCGDGYIFRGDIKPEYGRGSRPRWMEPIAQRLFPHVPRLHELAQTHGHEVRLFCAHDAFELSEFQASTGIKDNQAS
jgi:glyoxylase-like metal-dependent hydrolase (beta-lactamase superfamily II)